MTMKNNQIFVAQQAMWNHMAQYLQEISGGEANSLTRMTVDTEKWFAWLQQAKPQDIDMYTSLVGRYWDGPTTNTVGTAFFSTMVQTKVDGTILPCSVSLEGSWTQKGEGNNNNMHTFISKVGVNGHQIPIFNPDAAKLFLNTPWRTAVSSIEQRPWKHEKNRDEVDQHQEDLRLAAQDSLKADGEPDFENPYCRWTVSLSGLQLSKASEAHKKWDAFRQQFKQDMVDKGFAGVGYVQLFIAASVSSLIWRPAHKDSKGNWMPYNTMKLTCDAFEIRGWLAPTEPDSNYDKGFKKAMYFYADIAAHSKPHDLTNSFSLNDEIEEELDVVSQCDDNMELEITPELLENIDSPCLVNLVRNITKANFSLGSTKTQILAALEGHSVLLSDLIAAYEMGKKKYDKTTATLASYGYSSGDNPAPMPKQQEPKQQPKANETAKPKTVVTTKGATREDVLDALSKIMNIKTFNEMHTAKKCYVMWQLARVSAPGALPDPAVKYIKDGTPVEGFMGGYDCRAILAGIKASNTNTMLEIMKRLASDVWWRIQFKLSADPTVAEVKAEEKTEVKAEETEVIAEVEEVVASEVWSDDDEAEDTEVEEVVASEVWSDDDKVEAPINEVKTETKQQDSKPQSSRRRGDVTPDFV